MARRFSLLAVFAWTACSPETPVVTEVQRELVSPDRQRKVVLFTRNAGATTNASTHALLLGKSDALPGNPGGNVFIIDHGSTAVS